MLKKRSASAETQLKPTVTRTLADIERAAKRAGFDELAGIADVVRSMLNPKQEARITARTAAERLRDVRARGYNTLDVGIASMLARAVDSRDSGSP